MSLQDCRVASLNKAKREAELSIQGITIAVLELQFILDREKLSSVRLSQLKSIDDGLWDVIAKLWEVGIPPV